jgi:hypothetical protein
MATEAVLVETFEAGARACAPCGFSSSISLVPGISSKSRCAAFALPSWPFCLLVLRLLNLNRLHQPLASCNNACMHATAEGKLAGALASLEPWLRAGTRGAER